jgi:2-polyprenyl-3-methyl-5-hydroxy-6-metoxy-1,4-benzoquinol methylase
MRRLEIDYNLGVMDSLVSLARYNFVTRTINDKSQKVLDFGCGTGYGTKVLREHFKEVDCFDVVDEKDLGISEQRGIITDFNKLKSGHYDVVTCFEVIEHLDEATQTGLMERLHDLLNANGTLFISTVRKMDPPPTLNRQQEHIRELTYKELLDFCHRHFHNVYTFGQIDQVISTFYPENMYHFVFICTGKK